MSAKRQKIRYPSASDNGGRGEASKPVVGGIEAPTAKSRPESPAKSNEQLMEKICERDNCLRALKRVQSNKGSAGIDGMTVEQLPAYLKEHWPAIRDQLLRGTYHPSPVRRVEIPKPDVGVRKLGIPTVIANCT
jgi:RNA-directed DNA polymerase